MPTTFKTAKMVSRVGLPLANNAPDTALVEFAEKLVSKRAVPALQFARALGRIGSAKNQMDVQALQGGSAVGGPVVDNDFYGHATAQQGLFEHPL